MKPIHQAQPMYENDEASQPSDKNKTLSHLVSLVTTQQQPFEDVAEEIEDNVYELCENGSIDIAVKELMKISLFFESLDSKNDEHCRDLADVYLLIGQLHQYSELFAESIQWFNKAAIVDDRYAAPYHNMALSYKQIHQTEDVIKCFKQELLLAPGNYYTYLLLAEEYELEHQPADVERCLKDLLERNPDSIQGLHSLIKHYERSNPDINTTLLIRRLTGVNKKLSSIEIVLKSYYLCRERRFHDVVRNLNQWGDQNGMTAITCLVKAYVYNETHQYKKSRDTIEVFRELNHGRTDIMNSKMNEFKSLFGEAAADILSKILLLSPKK